MSSTKALTDARRRIEAAYDPELFRDAGRRFVELVTEHLSAAQQGQGPVLPWRPPAENADYAAKLLRSPESVTERDALAKRFAELVQTMLDRGQNLHNPNYIGHQVPASIPIGGLFDAVGSATNQVMAIYDMGPWATSVENALIDCLGEKIGWRSGEFGGLITHGGSLANLTALLTARNVTLSNAWEMGLANSPQPPVLVVNSDAHYSVARSAGILGIGTDRVIRVGLDERRRMDPDRLDEVLSGLRRRDTPVIAVSACACATPIGAFDPLREIAEVCRRHDVWLHVDAAHGGSACMSPRKQHLVDGLELADSIVWDAHKMLFVPALCAFVFYRNNAHKYEAFRQDAPYLFDPAAPGMAEFDSGLKTIECTKRAAAFGLWGVWSLFGPDLLTDLVDLTFDMGHVLFDKLTAAPDFEPLHEPQCNIVVFRYVPDSMRSASLEQLGKFQMELRRRLIESGRAYIVSTSIDGAGALRATVINPLTTPGHLDQLLDAVREIGAEMLKKS